MLQSALEGRLGDCKAAGEDELRFNCPRCSHTDHRLYVNPERSRNGVVGWFFCHECHFKGTLSFLCQYLGIEGSGDAVVFAPQLLREKLVRGVVADIPPAQPILEFPDAVSCVDHEASFRYLSERGLSAAQVWEAGLFVRMGDGYSRIYLPESHLSGITYAVSRRYLLGDTGPRYSSVGNSAARGVYRLTVCKPGDEIIITEGPFDSLVLWDNAVALYGTYLSASQFSLLRAMSSRFCVALDNDAIEFASQLCSELLACGCTVRWVHIPDGKDPAAIGRAVFERLKADTPILTVAELLRRRILAKPMRKVWR